jgi:hypothetical protein
MLYAPISRIALRYVAGTLLGLSLAETLAKDPDVVAVVSAGIAAAIGAGTELAYAYAKRRGWRT